MKNLLLFIIHFQTQLERTLKNDIRDIWDIEFMID